MATLKSLVDEITNIKNELVGCRDTLKQILIDKKIDTGSFNNLTDLIGLVRAFCTYSPYNIDLKTLWENRGSDVPSIWESNTLRYSGHMGHYKSAIYSDIGKNSGNISFKWKIDSIVSYSDHCIFRVRDSDLKVGNYYNYDGFNGFEIFYLGGKLLICVDSLVNGERVSLYTESISAGKDYLFDITWDSLGFNIIRDGVHYFNHKYKTEKKDCTIVEMGYALYQGSVTYTLVR